MAKAKKPRKLSKLPKSPKKLDFDECIDALKDALIQEMIEDLYQDESATLDDGEVKRPSIEFMVNGQGENDGVNEVRHAVTLQVTCTDLEAQAMIKMLKKKLLIANSYEYGDDIIQFPINGDLNIRKIKNKPPLVIPDDFRSTIRKLAEKDPNYAPSCTCLDANIKVPMMQVERFYWRCERCAAEWDERNALHFTKLSPSKKG